jgi:hypothetical protein
MHRGVFASSPTNRRRLGVWLPASVEHVNHMNRSRQIVIVPVNVEQL